MPKSPDAFRTISEVAEWLGVQAHVLRFWESKFSQVKPVKRAGGRRYYRPADMLLLGGIRKLLHGDGMTIKGVQKTLREHGVGHVSDQSAALDDLTMAQLDGETVSASDIDVGTVLPFQSRDEEKVPDTDDSVEVEAGQSESAGETPPEPATPPAEPAPVTELPEENAAASSETESASALPSFMRKPAADTIDTTPPPAKKPRIVSAPDGPLEDEIQVPAGMLAKAASLRRIAPQNLAAMRAAYDQLASLHARLSGTGKE